MHEIRVRRSAEIVMLGDSLTAYPNWTELTGWRSVANRGLSGDTTADVLARIQDVNDLSPKLVFLLVGVNDAALGVKVEQSAKNILEIVARLKTKVYIIRPFPTNDARTNATLGSLYAETRSLVGDSAHYIDINKRLGGETILPQFTTDGVHLSPSGYAVWRDAMLEIAEDDD